MEDASNGNFDVVKRGPGARFGEGPDANNHFGLQMFDGSSERTVADIEKRLCFRCRQFVRGTVSAALLEEGQRAIVGDEESFEETLWSAEHVARPSPQPAAADLGTGAGEAHDPPLRVLVFRPPDLGINSEPVTHGADFTEGYAGLSHSPGSGIHTEEKDFLGSIAIPLEVLTVSLPRVIQRVVNVGHRRREPEAAHVLAKVPGDIDEY